MQIHTHIHTHTHTHDLRLFFSMNISEEYEVYDYFNDYENRFSSGYEDPYAAATANSSAEAVVTDPFATKNDFSSPIAWWLSLFLAVVASLSMATIIYRSNQRIKRENLQKRASEVEFEIDVDDSAAVVDDVDDDDDGFFTATTAQKEQETRLTHTDLSQFSI